MYVSCIVYFVEFYYICPTNAQYLLKITVSSSIPQVSIFHIILRESLIMYAKVTELIKWEHL